MTLYFRKLTGNILIRLQEMHNRSEAGRDTNGCGYSPGTPEPARAEAGGWLSHCKIKKRRKKKIIKKLTPGSLLVVPGCGVAAGEAPGSPGP